MTISRGGNVINDHGSLFFSCELLSRESRVVHDCCEIILIENRLHIGLVVNRMFLDHEKKEKLRNGESDT